VASNALVLLLELASTRTRSLAEPLWEMKTRKSPDYFARVRESRICWLIRRITGEIVGLSTC
jgi:hypothetical protein